MRTIVPQQTEAEKALLTLIDWASANFNKEVADGVNALVRTGLQALRDRTFAADHYADRVLQAEAYATELESQRDYISQQLMSAETAGRVSFQRDTIREMSQTLGVTPTDAINLLKTLTGETAHLIGYYQIEQAAELARDITADLRREALPLDADDSLPALSDDFDTDEDNDVG